MRFVLPLFLVTVASCVPSQPPADSAPRLQLQTYVADSTSFHVVSALIIGPTEVMLVDAQMAMSHAGRVADMIAASGRRLTAIVITHPDEDHAFGLQAILTRFPGTPVYMTPAGIAEFERQAPMYMRGVQQALKGDAPDSVVIPTALPSNRLTVDGETVEIVPDQQGDVLARTNSFVFIPSLEAVIAGDLVFDGVHPYLANSTFETRAAWRESLKAIEAKQPKVLVPGHKPTAQHPDSPDALRFMADYLHDFDDARRSAANADQMIASLRRTYPTLLVPGLMEWSAKRAFAPATP